MRTIAPASRLGRHHVCQALVEFEKTYLFQGQRESCTALTTLASPSPKLCCLVPTIPRETASALEVMVSVRIGVTRQTEWSTCEFPSSGSCLRSEKTRYHHRRFPASSIPACSCLCYNLQQKAQFFAIPLSMMEIARPNVHHSDSRTRCLLAQRWLHAKQRPHHCSPPAQHHSRRRSVRKQCSLRRGTLSDCALVLREYASWKQQSLDSVDGSTTCETPLPRRHMHVHTNGCLLLER